jgi:two-component system, chemotaxis family, chemotaxis protein CheY
MAFNPKIKILVVDDMNTMRKIIKGMLQKMGCDNITEANDGIPAWEEVKKAYEIGQPYEFIISDWNMPGMTGLDFLKNVRSLEGVKSTPFLMVTAEAEQANVVVAVKAGVSNYIIKPFTPDTLRIKIDKIFPK